MSAIAGAIIAGGQGQRLGGVRKAHLKLGGIALIDRVITALNIARADLVISTGRWPQHHFAGHGGTLVADLEGETGGPLAGLAAAVEHLRALPAPPELLLTSAVDVPFLPVDFQLRLKTGMARHAASYARVGETFYPTNALWRLASIIDLPDQVRAGTAPKSLKRLLQDLNGQPIDWPDMPNPFANINAMADLLALSQRQ